MIQVPEAEYEQHRKLLAIARLAIRMIDSSRGQPDFNCLCGRRYEAYPDRRSFSDLSDAVDKLPRSVVAELIRGVK